MKFYNKYIGVMSLFMAAMFSSCEKQDAFLNVKSNKTDVVPSTVADFQKVLDNYTIMNATFPNIGYAGTDNLVIPDKNLAGLDKMLKNAYLWEKDIFEGASSRDWVNSYSVLERANIVLDGLDRINSKGNQSEFNNVKGSALFYRALCHYMVSQLFCKTYDQATAANDNGIIVRTTSDVNIKPVRYTMKQTYDQMISDLTEAISLLPAAAVYQTRPSRPAANGLLAKVYLVMGDYPNAEKYATSSLSDQDALIDFNDLIITSTSYRFPAFPNNPEISFYAYANSDGTRISSTTNGTSFINPDFYNSYLANDIRKKAFFLVDNPQQIHFFGSYTTAFPFSGIASNEMYLIKAEAHARLKQVTPALEALNNLLIKRYDKATFNKLTITDPDLLLRRILSERRKEFPMSGQLRWEDLRRLNKEPEFEVQLSRTFNGNTYTLLPNSPRYVYPIPDDEITLSGIPQNIR